MYQNLYDLINTYIFSGTVVPGEYTDLVCTLCATFGNLLVIAVPFMLLFWIVKKILGVF